MGVHHVRRMGMNGETVSQASMSRGVLFQARKHVLLPLYRKHVSPLDGCPKLIDGDGDGEVNEDVFQVNEEVVQFEGGFLLLDLHASAHLSSYDARKYFPDRPRSESGLCLR